MSLKQRVPLATLDPDGKYRITIEWLKDLQASIISTITNTLTITPADLTSLLARVTALEASRVAMALQIAALTDEVEKLKKGYQS